MNKYEELISKVSKDIDKKSVYSKKMQSKFQQNQQKQAAKNRNLLKNNTTQRIINKADDIFAQTQKQSTNELETMPQEDVKDYNFGPLHHRNSKLNMTE